MTLTRTQAKSYYDRFGKKQDAQSFYEDAALDALIAHAAFERSAAVVELGCGTGRFAVRLLSQHLPPAATYLGIDLSQTMIDIATPRLAPYKERAQAVCSDGSLNFQLADHSVDRVVSTYVLDLLPEADIRQVIAEAQRVLVPGGKLCLASLTVGVTFTSRMVATLWSGVFRINAAWVGGCRPLQLAGYLDKNRWAIDYQNVVTQFGVPSEVLVASPLSVNPKSAD